MKTIAIVFLLAISMENSQSKNIERSKRSFHNDGLHGYYNIGSGSGLFNLGTPTIRIDQLPVINVIAAAKTESTPTAPPPAPSGPQPGQTATTSLQAFVPIQLNAMYSVPGQGQQAIPLPSLPPPAPSAQPSQQIIRQIVTVEVPKPIPYPVVRHVAVPIKVAVPKPYFVQVPKPIPVTPPYLDASERNSFQKFWK